MVTDDRGSLPFRLVHGEALAAAAAWALGEAGVQPVDLTVPVGLAARGGRAGRAARQPLPAHAAGLHRRCVTLAVEGDEVVVGVRPVTDTVKQVADGVVGATVDREPLRRRVLAGGAARCRWWPRSRTLPTLTSRRSWRVLRAAAARSASSRRRQPPAGSRAPTTSGCWRR